MIGPLDIVALAGAGQWLARWTPPAVLAAGGGSALLLLTPASAFADVVPFLVAGSAVALVLEPWMARRRDGFHTARGPLLGAGLTATGLYGGYFGAGSGVMILTLLLLTVDARLPRANALKNMLVGTVSVAGTIVFTVFADVSWAAVIPLAAGEFAGSMLGPRLVRRLPGSVVRGVIVLVAIGLAVQLWLAHHRA